MYFSKNVAAFDFDGTLTYHDTLFSFLKYSVGSVKTFWLLFLELPFLILYLLGRVSRQKMKERVLTRFFRGTPYSELESLGRSFAKEVLRAHMKPWGFERIRYHKEKGDTLILISASLEVYLEPFAKELGFDACLASRLEKDLEGRVTGNLFEKNCWGEEKVCRLLAYTGPKTYTLFAYGNSRGDLELLQFSDFPFKV
jgi:HAD superfamily hydrolase (TIGR01490 family)